MKAFYEPAIKTFFNYAREFQLCYSDEFCIEFFVRGLIINTIHNIFSISASIYNFFFADINFQNMYIKVLNEKRL